jgi:hypothetical protein
LPVGSIVGYFIITNIVLLVVSCMLSVMHASIAHLVASWCMKQSALTEARTVHSTAVLQFLLGMLQMPRKTRGELM